MKDFINLCLRTESKRLPPADETSVRLLHAAMGMVTESGEFLDALKKHIFYGKPLDEVNLCEEIGDQLWYIAIALDALGSSFEMEMERVVKKLQTRYPERFTDEAAINRNLDAERSTLESFGSVSS